MKDLLYKLPRHFLRSFSGRNVLWHLFAAALTYGLVVSGFDWWYFLATRNVVLDAVLFPAIIIGGLVPLLMLLAIPVLIRTHVKETRIIAAAALGQAVILGSVISSLYKAFTGRIQPDLANAALDISKDFQFGLLENGIFWGWPSSHTTIAFAMAWTLICLYPKNAMLRYGALAYALYIGLGVSVSIHWFSEFIAGAIIGSVIGIVVGTSFQRMTTKLQNSAK